MNIKKVLSLLLIVAMVIGTLSYAFADPTEDFHVEPSTEATTEANGPEVVEYMDYSQKTIEPGSLSGDVNLSNVGRGLYYDGVDFYFFLDTGVMASNYMITIEGDRFFFGEDGKMVKNELISYDGEIYFFDINGAMYKNRWYTSEEVDVYDNKITYVDYYFGPTGRAYRASDNSQGLVLKTIDGEKYGFNTNGEKLEGYYDYQGNKYDTDEVEAYAFCDYYFDPQEHGIAKTGWHYYSGAVRGEEYDDKEEIVLYFDDRTCRKVRANSTDSTRAIARTIEGQRYMFDRNGVRKNKWYSTEAGRATSSNVRYFNEEYDGYMAKGWFVAIPSKDSIMEVNRERHEASEEMWFYSGSNGNILRNTIRKIGNYVYAFDADGVMQEDCLVRVKNGTVIKSYSIDNLYRSNVVLDYYANGDAEEGRGATEKQDTLTKDKGLVRTSDGERWLYFYGSEMGENRVGSMCSVNTPVKISLNDEDIYFICNSAGGYTTANSTTMGSIGIVKYSDIVNRNGKLIQNGVLMKPIDNNYGIVRFSVQKHQYGATEKYITRYNEWKEFGTGGAELYDYVLVDSSGSQITMKNTCKKDRNGNYIYIGSRGEFLGLYPYEGRALQATSDFTYTDETDGTLCTVRAGDIYWEYKPDKKFIKGFPTAGSRMDSKYMWLNFTDNDVIGCKGPYEDGLASYVYR